MKRAILFDLDHTLFDHPRALRRYLRGLDLPASIVERLVELDAAGSADRGALCTNIFELSARFASPDEVWAHFRQTFPTCVEIEPAVRAAVESAARRFEVGLLTNGGSDTQQAKLEQLGLVELFGDRVVISGGLGVAKPDPGAFRAILDRVGVRAEEAVYCGDDPVRDVAGAARAGMSTCWVSRGRSWPDAAASPDWIVETIADIDTLWDEPG